MKRMLLALTIAALSPWVGAQTPATQTDPPQSGPSTEPSSSMRDSSTTGTGNYSNGSDDDKWQMKSCLAQQRQANPQASDADIQRICEKLRPKGEVDR